MTRALLILVLLALIVVVGLSFVGGDSSENRRETIAPANQPGYFLMGATITDTAEDGSLRMRIEAARIEQIPTDNSVELSTLHLTYIGSEDHGWLVTADHGVVPAESKIVHLSGNVRVRGLVADGLPEAVIETPTLDFDTSRSTARTDDFVTVVIGSQSLSAHGLDADLKQRHLQLESRVHGQFNPPFNR
jgi:LPS export ABC transporter protein LptC